VGCCVATNEAFPKFPAIGGFASLMILTLLISDRSPCLEELSPLQGCTDRVVGGFKWSSGEQPTRLSRASG
jgi:hypothetical protein